MTDFQIIWIYKNGGIMTAGFELPQNVIDKIQIRQLRKRESDYYEADKLRSELQELGYDIRDMND